MSHLPNAITMLRGALGPVVLALLVGYGWNLACFWVFVAAIATDMVDGWVARKLGATSQAALFLDPLADKLLTGFSWGALAIVGHAPALLAVLMIVRDLAIGVAWAWGTRRRATWVPLPLGQVAVAFEGIAVSVLLFHGPWLQVHWPTVGAILGWGALGLSLVGLLEYAWVPPPSEPS